MSERFRIKIAVYLLAREGSKVLLSLRENTGWKDGWYSLVAGHVDGGESAEMALVREAKEEAGIDIDTKDLKHVFTMHRTADNPLDEYIDLFFECNTWNGTLTNAEPEKCGGVEWVEDKALPDNVLDYVKYVIENYPKGKSYASRERAI